MPVAGRSRSPPCSAAEDSRSTPTAPQAPPACRAGRRGTPAHPADRPPPTRVSATLAPTASARCAGEDPELAGVILAELDRQSGTPPAHGGGELHLAAPCSPPSAHRWPTSTPRATRATATTRAASSSTSPSGSPSSAPPALFGAEHANVQPYSGSSAVLAAYAGAARPRRHRARPPRLPHGGHLTHGSPVQLLRPLVPLHRLRGRAATPGSSTTTRSATWPARTAPRLIVVRGHRLPAAPGLRRLPGDRRRGRRLSDRRRRPHPRPGRRRRRAQPGAVRGRGLRAPRTRRCAAARRADPVRRGAGRAGRPGGLPRSRRAARTCTAVAAKAVALRRGRRRRPSPPTPTRSSPTRGLLAARAGHRGLSTSSPAVPTPT